MHAVVVQVRISDLERAQRGLERDVIPRVSSAPGFQAGYWTRNSDGEINGLSMIVFDSEENARNAAGRVREIGTPEGVTLDDVQVREVVASA